MFDKNIFLFCPKELNYRKINFGLLISWDINQKSQLGALLVSLLLKNDIKKNRKVLN